MDIARLSQAEPPWLHLSEWDDQDAKWLPRVIYCESPGSVLRILRGKKMTSFAEFMNEVGAALQFPDFFGENWNAFEDLLEHLDELVPGKSYILYFSQAELLFPSDPESLHWLLFRLNEAAAYWSKVTPAVPFHVLFKCQPEYINEMSMRLRKAAAGKIQIDGLI